MIYLFKQYYNNAVYDEYRFIEAPVSHLTATSSARINFNDQLAAAREVTSKHIMQVILPLEPDQTTAFRVHGKKGDHTRNLIYVNPYTAEVRGQVNQRDTLMYKVRKLHGELLLSKPGTYLVELTASWFLVLIVTGLYVWWPSKAFRKAGVAGFLQFGLKKENTYSTEICTRSVVSGWHL